MDWWWKRGLQARAGKASGSSTLGTDTPPAWGGTQTGRNSEKTHFNWCQKKALKYQTTSCLRQPASFTPSLMLPGISPTAFRTTFPLKGRLTVKIPSLSAHRRADGGCGCSYLSKLDPTLHSDAALHHVTGTHV